MPEREVDINFSETNIPASDPESPMFDAAARQRRIIQVLERGIMADRLHVDLPPHVHGEWVPSDPIEVERKKALGFEIDKEYAAKNAVHSAGDGTARVGDVVFMTCSRETKDYIDAYNRNRYRQANDPKALKEAIQFRNRLKEEAQKDGYEMPDVDRGSISRVGERDILNQVQNGSLTTTGERLDKPTPGPNQIVFKQ